MKPLPLTAEMALAAIQGRKTETRRPLKYQPSLKFWPENYGKLTPGDYWFWETPTRTNGRNLWGGWATIEEMKAKILCGGRQAPFGLPGEECWLREPGRIAELAYSDESVPLLTIEYLADKVRRVVALPDRLGVEDLGRDPSWLKVGRGIPNGIFREAARFKTLILEVRVERLWDITPEGVEADGVEVVRSKDNPGWPAGVWAPRDDRPFYGDHRGGYHANNGPMYPDICNCGESQKHPLPAHHCAMRALWDRIYGKRPGLAWADNPWVTVTSWDRMVAI